MRSRPADEPAPVSPELKATAACAKKCVGLIAGGFFPSARLGTRRFRCGNEDHEDSRNSEENRKPFHSFLNIGTE